MPAGDSLALRQYINKIEPGVDLNVEVEVPGGRLGLRWPPFN